VTSREKEKPMTALLMMLGTFLLKNAPDLIDLFGDFADLLKSKRASGEDEVTEAEFAILEAKWGKSAGDYLKEAEERKRLRGG
jgi:hypothetical protein